MLIDVVSTYYRWTIKKQTLYKTSQQNFWKTTQMSITALNKICIFLRTSLNCICSVTNLCTPSPPLIKRVDADVAPSPYSEMNESLDAAKQFNPYTYCLVVINSS